MVIDYAYCVCSKCTGVLREKNFLENWVFHILPARTQ